MSTLNTEEQELFDTAKRSLPRFMFQKDAAPQETFGAAAKVLNLAKQQIKSWLASTYILQATGFWLDQHAIDRGTRRRSGETDAALASRIRQVEDAVTLPALTNAVNAVLTAAGVAGSATIVELHGKHAFIHAAGSAKHQFWGRGYRFGGGDQYPGNGTRQIIVILPTGSSTALANAIADACRRLRGAGYSIVVEVANYSTLPRISILPVTASGNFGGATITFTATLGSGLVGPATWAVDGVNGGNTTIGTINSSGVYTPPATRPSSGNVRQITATIGTSIGKAYVSLT